MMRSKPGLILALLFPIAVLLGITIYKDHILNTGYEVIFPVTGYDPRDILSGHYVTYTVQYDVPNLCKDNHDMHQTYLCLDHKTVTAEPDNNCHHYIRGICRTGRFEAGIEKFYIPENMASELDKQVRAKNASIIVSVSPQGEAVVKELLINNKSWNQK